ncbi:MAG: glutamine--fructose-6-phosphate transaminase (isomerizing) [Chloroflexota bacterium]|nr:glutamine--fructose-6-phosphate transaminase (isomerizing) [Chloroflexota bacterium]MDQ5865881.1 glutamine--fructose-6-phosphate transaminase (isomerizing) [Chloroflexota bacterium]
MCGIVGYVGPREATGIIVEGLCNLEYRGYDSAGLAVQNNGSIERRRAAGKLSNLRSLLQDEPVTGHRGIGHTRWATHGKVNEANAHPHRDCTGDIVVIQNGIVENYLELKGQLRAQGHEFHSETDTEVLPHLLEQCLKDGAHDLQEAMRQMLLSIRGSHAIVAMRAQEPDLLVAARLGNAGGVVIGYGEGEMFVASDQPAILQHTRRLAFLEPGEYAVLTSDDARYYKIDGSEVQKQPQQVAWDPISAAKGGYKHFMLKEIHEQPRALMDTLRGRVDVETGRVDLTTVRLTTEEIRQLKEVVILACGTAFHAGLAGKYIIEELARIPVSVEYASEYRYRNPVVEADTLAVIISQSGETVDTLEAMAEASQHGARVLSIVNVIGSQADRMSESKIHVQAGPEIAVASTKVFTGMIADLVLLGMLLGQARGTLDEARSRELAEALMKLPNQAGDLLADESLYDELAGRLHNAEDMLYLGRGVNYPTALEGALKIKEISYIHAEGCPAGEMKHGINALIDNKLPVVCIALQDHVYSKMLSTIEQVKARDGIVVAIATEGDEAIRGKADEVIYIPQVHYLLSPILASMPLQMLAYKVAVRRGADVDQPRNLAKSVTVE